MMAIHFALRRVCILCRSSESLLRSGEEGAVRHKLGIWIERHTESGLVREVDSAVHRQGFVEEQISKRRMHRLAIW